MRCVGRLCRWGVSDAQVRTLLRLGAFPEVGEGSAAWLGAASGCRAAAYAELMQQVAMGATDRVESLMKLVGAEPRVTDLASFGGETPLHWAASFGRLDTARALIGLGAEVDAANDDGVRPLHEAAKGAKTALVTLLLEHGADADAVVADGPDAGKTALDLAKDDGARSALAAKTRRAAAAPAAAVSAESRRGPERTVPPPKPTACRAPLVWPPPRRCRLLAGVRGDLEVSSERGELEVGVESANPVFAEAVGYLSQLLAVRLEPVAPGDDRYEATKIRLALCDATTAGAEAYRIAVTPQCARLVAADSSGLRYGVATLAQLLRFYATADGLALRLPAVAVDDGPDARVRASTADLRSISGPSLPRLLDDLYRLAHWRVNTLFVLVDDSVDEAFLEAVSARCVLLGTIALVPTWLVDPKDLPKRVDRVIATLSPEAGRRACRGAALKLPTQWLDSTEEVVVGKFSRFARHLEANWTEAMGRGTLWLWGASDHAFAACEAALDEAARALGRGARLSIACVADASLSSRERRSSLAEAARIANARPFSADCVIVGGADARRPTALRQAPLLASLVVAARSCRAERAAGVVVRPAPAEPELAAYAKPFADATAIVGAGLAWRADAGRDLSQAELEALVAAHLWRYDPPVAGASADEAAAEVRDKHLAAFLLGDEHGELPPTGPSPTDRRAAAAAALVCGRDERVRATGDGRGRSLLAECQRGDHIESEEGRTVDAARDEVEDDEADLWPPAYSTRALAVGRARDDDDDDDDLVLSDEALRARAAAAAVAKRFVFRLARATIDVASNPARSLALRGHLKRLSLVVKTAPDDRREDLWKWRHNELGYFFDSRSAAPDDQDEEEEEEELILDEDDDDDADIDDDEPVFFFDRGADPAVLDHRLRRVVDELRVLADLLRWMARLRTLLLSRARDAAPADAFGDRDVRFFPPEPPARPSTPQVRALLGAIPSGTRSDVANRLLELLQRAAAVWVRPTPPLPVCPFVRASREPPQARRHKPKSAVSPPSVLDLRPPYSLRPPLVPTQVRSAFRAAPLFIAEITFDLPNFKSAELERLILASVA